MSPCPQIQLIAALQHCCEYRLRCQDHPRRSNARNFHGATLSTMSPPVGSSFTVRTTVVSPAYEAYGVQVSAAPASSGLSLLGVSTTREDGVTMDFPNAANLTLGTVTEADTRSAIWRFSVNGPQTIRFRAWSNNGGTVFKSVTVTP